MDSINVNWEQVMTIAEKMKAYSEQVYSHMNTINSEMKKLKTDYGSESYLELNGNFASVKNKMDDFNELFSAYAAALNTSAEKYKKTEKRIDGDATGLVIGNKKKPGSSVKDAAKGKSSKLK